ncbi:Catalase-related peroxidase [Rhodovastum atsumiense]|uniref:Catalase-related peroxidase n=1 Tax=Rhodovastum atsumiense TaxID=504468 RepID=A0A5M6J0S4_9PROT|nr:catalase family peroxidase [Rhodovastum atsumiense]KAA5614172.1 catalase family peroxidase [Rhodovastum atsumiense]CAH2599028.1 Catalase-related peroxidase [Rhodovastum atsumiense]
MTEKPPPIPRLRAMTGLAGRFALIGAVLGLLAGSFAYVAGWLSPGRLTPERIVDALSARGGDPVGHRRNHAKGVCFTGTFEANGAGQRLSAAPVLAAGRYPVVGRFAIATGDPQAPDASGRVRSMAIRVTAPDGQEWRSGMNAMPVFPLATPEAFYEQTVAARVDPATGRPDPQALQRFAAAHPETAPFVEWARTAPWTASYAEESYNSLNAFRFVDAAGVRRNVRWSMLASVPQQATTPAELAKLGPDFLAQDLMARLREAPLRWNLMVTVAEPGDPVNDPTRAWPSEREQVQVGTLVVERAEAEANGPCRDLNFDPLVLPAGIEPSEDPILLARSPAYANSFNRRESEAGHLPAPRPATGGAK